MSGYTKLFSSIITSTIWSEDDKTRIVWITMLAIADKNGEVQGSIPGIARIAGVPVENTREAVAKFMSTDPDSRTKDDGGRRLEAIEGGWRLLNHRKYREMASKEESKDAEAKRKAAWREQQKRNGHVPDMSRTCPKMSQDVPKKSHIAEAEAEAEAEMITEKTTYPEKVTIIWDMFPATSRNRSSMAKLERSLAKLRPKPATGILVAAIKQWQASAEWKNDGGKYVSGVHAWIADRKWETPPAAIPKTSCGNHAGFTEMKFTGEEF